eukprot:scaffold113672_cov68-Phaeocystis_antarctica.AAC.2
MRRLAAGIRHFATRDTSPRGQKLKAASLCSGLPTPLSSRQSSVACLRWSIVDSYLAPGQNTCSPGADRQTVRTARTPRYALQAATQYSPQIGLQTNAEH